MNTIIQKARQVVRRYQQRARKTELQRTLDFKGQRAHDHIRSVIDAGSPAMLCRFGRNELEAVLEYARLIASYGTGERYDPGLYLERFENLRFQAGVFPIRPDYVARFYHRMMADIREIDVLGSWLVEELDLRGHLDGVVRVRLHDLDPVIFSVARPWTVALRGKRVLVVHPFDRSIRAQYEKRKLLFDNPDTLPDFDLVTIRAVQNPAWTFSEAAWNQGREDDSVSVSTDWFKALELMEREIAAAEFDVALIGCGAYGFPLAAHVKRLGKQAVHMGGATQLLFGIMGKRWLDKYGFTGHNEHWVFPLPEETPREAATVERSGAYWR